MIAAPSCRPRPVRGEILHRPAPPLPDPRPQPRAKQVASRVSPGINLEMTFPGKVINGKRGFGFPGFWGELRMMHVDDGKLPEKAHRGAREGRGHRGGVQADR